MEPAHNVEMNRLLDFYGPLLTERQAEMMRLRLEEDLTLGEIALAMGISRQAVHDALHKAEKTLTDMEEKLHLAQRYLLLQERVRQAEDQLRAGNVSGAEKILSEMRQEGVYGV